MPWTRALLAWLIIFVAESIHGTLRTLYLAPAIGEALSVTAALPADWPSQALFSPANGTALPGA